MTQLQETVEASSLSQEDKDLWLRAMELLDDDQSQTILDVITEDPFELEALTKNLKAKQAAIASGDMTSMDAVLEAEAKELTT